MRGDDRQAGTARVYDFAAEAARRRPAAVADGPSAAELKASLLRLMQAKAARVAPSSSAPDTPR